MAIDEHTYGFNKDDALSVLQGVGGRDVEFSELVSPGVVGLVLKTPSGGIAARSGSTVSSAVCTVWDRSSSTLSASSRTVSIFNLSTTAVAADVFIVALRTNIGLVAVWEDC